MGSILCPEDVPYGFAVLGCWVPDIKTSQSDHLLGNLLGERMRKTGKTKSKIWDWGFFLMHEIWSRCSQHPKLVKCNIIDINPATQLFYKISDAYSSFLSSFVPVL